jgi:uncharacterized membrane protein YbhN (UPF0104 family)
MAVVQKEHRKRSLRDRAIGLLIQLALFAFVFGWLLPRFIDYEETWDAITSLAWWQFLVLFGLSVVRIPTEAMIYRALLPSLSLRVGSEAYLSQNFGGLLPPPSSSIVQYAYFRSDGFERRSSLIGAIGSFIFPTAGRLVMPVVAFALLVITGNFKPEAIWLVVISLTTLLIAGFLVWLIGRSDRSALWVGSQSGRAVSWVLAKFRKEPVTGLGEMLVSFRNHTYTVVRQRWLAGSIAVSLNLLLTFVLLLISLRFVGLSNDELPASSIFAALAVSFLAGTVLPLSSSGMGTVDLFLIASLSALSGNASVAAAGEVVWRVFYSVLAIPVGVFTLNRFRKKNGHLLTDAWAALTEMREEAATAGDATAAEPSRASPT